MAQSATGTNYGPLLNAQNIEFTAGQTATKTKTQTVPGSIPAGTYTYSAYVGDYPTNTVWDSAGFTFSKTGIRDQGLGISPIEEWSIAVWDDSQQLTANNQQPMEYMLGSAYPNPFNPSTEISYALPEAGKVTLAVFNTLGRQIATLENGYKPAGYYSVKFDGSQLSSGVYYYTIKVNSFAQTKKMLLIK
jgi:hypothetical protein